MTAAPLDLLRQIEFLAPLDDDTLGELALRATAAGYRAGQRIVGELESGADVFLLVEGHADVVVEPRRGTRRVLQTLGPGSAFGEMASLTGELRSASVIATDDVKVLVIHDTDFDRLRQRRPEVAIALLGMLARRLADTDRAIDALMTVGVEHEPGPPVDVSRGAIRRVWRELVVNRHRDLAFLTLASFVVTLVAVRLAVYLSFRFDVAPRGVLRTAYMSGFALLFFSAAAALLTFRPVMRKIIAIAYGIGAALIFNELGVTLAFDIFYKDIHTPDPNTPFDIEKLYERASAFHAIAIALVVLVQAAYLRGFYARAGFVLMTRIRKLLSR